MFLVFNKEKIRSYIILLSTVLILFGLATGIREDKAIETNANTIDNNTIDNIINDYLQNNIENKVDLKTNDIQNILEKNSNILN